MSKKIVVNESDNVKIIKNVSKLVTNLTNGETCTWVPEDETRLITKSIVKDGTYIAKKDVGSPYGYSQVIVNGVGNKVLGQLGEISITKNGTYLAENDSDGPFYGYSRVVVDISGGESGDGGGTTKPVVGKDDNGDDAEVITDDTGHITTKKLPTRISISVYPNNLVYEDGQQIDFTGLQVKAFLPDDTAWGIVPDGELIKPVTVAEFDEETYVEGSKTASSELLSEAIPFGDVYREISMHTTGNYIYSYTYTIDFQDKDGVVICYTAGYVAYPIFASSKQDAKYGQATDTVIINRITGTTTGESHSAPNYIGPMYNTYTYNNKTVYYTRVKRTMSTESGSGVVKPPLVMTTTPGFSDEACAWTAVYGNITSVSSSSQQTITLQWKRPGDAKVLETSFLIAVHEPNDENNASGSTMPGSGSNVDVPQ